MYIVVHPRWMQLIMFYPPSMELRANPCVNSKYNQIKSTSFFEKHHWSPRHQCKQGPLSSYGHTTL